MGSAALIMDQTFADDLAERLGRCEDLALSPDGTRLAVAAYTRETICIVDLVTSGDDQPSFVELPMSSARQPHGVAFVNDDVIVVANRRGDVVLFRLERGPAGTTIGMNRLPMGGLGLQLVDRPGSVTVAPAEGSAVELLVCQNRSNVVSAHRVVIAADRAEVVDNRVAVEYCLATPDGVAVHDDIVAVSNHMRHVISLHLRSAAPGSEPVAILTGCASPHGLAFTPDGRYLLAADAGGAFLQLYERPGEVWSGGLEPVRLLRVADDKTVASAALEEGGPKGVAIDSVTRRAVVVGEYVPFTQFSLDDLASGRIGEPYDRDAALAYENRCVLAAHRHGLELARAERWVSRSPKRLASRTTGRAMYEVTRLARVGRSFAGRRGAAQLEE